jgi:hypothetical protein
MADPTNPLPMERLPTTALQSMEDTDLFRAERDLLTTASILTTLAGLCANRAKAVRSVLSRRSADRDRGMDPTPRPGREGRGGLALVRPDGEIPVFSDHAVLRWLERRHGVDPTAVRAEMTAAYDAGGTMAGGGIVVSGDMCFVRTAKGMVKTIIPLEWLRDEDVELAGRTFREGR